MKLVRNTGNDRVVDLVSPELTASRSLDVVTPHLSIFGFAALRETLARIASTRMILPLVGSDNPGLDGDAPSHLLVHLGLGARGVAQERVLGHFALATGPLPQMCIRDSTSSCPVA